MFLNVSLKKKFENRSKLFKREEKTKINFFNSQTLVTSRNLGNLIKKLNSENF